jgi:uncharacterized protein (DUF1501 family)
MNRRDFILSAAVLAAMPRFAFAASPFDRLLVLIELKGGNDGLNTVIPYADPQYARLRPRLAIKREEVIQLSDREGLHPSLSALMPLWQSNELAVVQGVGYARPNLSHFRSIEIWDTASQPEEYLGEGWLARALSANPVPSHFSADGVVIGAQEMGPLSGSRAIALADTERFARQSKLAAARAARGPAALSHVLRVESDIVQAASGLAAQKSTVRTQFPAGAFGNGLRVAADVIGANAGVAAIKISLNGFDTHQNQAGLHGNLLRQLADGLAAFKAALIELGKWDSTLIMSYAEFGRRPAENQSAGTDHGTASVHFVTGGRVKGGLYGEVPKLDALDGGNLPFAVDFRSLYATALERWWGLESRGPLKGRFAPLDLIRT